MQTTQVSAFLENRPGRLLFLFNSLAEAGINLIAHNIVDASDFGIVHMLLDNPQRGMEVVRASGMTCSATQVLQVTVADEPGAFVNQVLKPLAAAGINIEYSYTYSTGCVGEARIVIKVDDVVGGAKALAALKRDA